MAGGGPGGPTAPPPPVLRIPSQCLNCIKIIWQGGANQRKLRRIGALKFHGWEPNSTVLGQLDNSEVSKAKGVFDPYVWYPEYIRPAGFQSGSNRFKWGGTESKYPQVRTGEWWLKDDQYAVKHIAGKNLLSYPPDVKFVAKLEMKQVFLNWPWSANGDYPHVIFAQVYNYIMGFEWPIDPPPWSRRYMPMTGVSLKMYRYTSEKPTYKPHPTEPPPAKVFDKMVPDKDYWKTVTLSLDSAGNFQEEIENDEPREYDQRSTFTQGLTSEGYLPWKTNKWPDPYGGSPEPEWWTETSYYKETGTHITANQIPKYNYGTNAHCGIAAHAPDLASYSYPNPVRPTKYNWSKWNQSGSGSNPLMWAAAWRPPNDSEPYFFDEQYLRIKIYAVVGDKCSACYYKDLTYTLSLKYNNGSCQMETDENISFLEFDWGTETSETFQVQINPASLDSNGVTLVKTIDWLELSPGNCRHITDFKLDSIS